MKNTINEILSLMDRVDSSFVLTEAVDPEVIYERYYKDIPEEIFIKLIKMDSLSKFDENDKLKFISPNAKWLLSMYRTDNKVKNLVTNNINATTDILDIYNDLVDSKKRYSKSIKELKKNYSKLYKEGDPENEVVQKHLEDLRKRINHAEKNIPDVKDSIMDYDSYDELVDSISVNMGKELRQSDKQVKRKGAEILFNDGKYMVVHTTTRAANQLYGKGAVWCTTMRDREHYWEEYSRKGSLFIIRNLEDSSDLHQLFISKEGYASEFRDIDNHDILDNWSDCFYDSELIVFILNLAWNFCESKQSVTEEEFRENSEPILEENTYTIYRYKAKNLYRIMLKGRENFLWPYFEEVNLPKYSQNYVIGKIYSYGQNFSMIRDIAYDVNALPTEGYIRREYDSFYEEYYDTDNDEYGVENGYCIVNIKTGQVFTTKFEAGSIREEENTFLFFDEYNEHMSIFNPLTNNFEKADGKYIFSNFDLDTFDGYILILPRKYEDDFNVYAIYDLTKCEFLSFDGKTSFDKINLVYNKEDERNNGYISFLEIIVNEKAFYLDSSMKPIEYSQAVKNRAFDSKISSKYVSKDGRTYVTIKNTDGDSISLYDYSTKEKLEILGQTDFKNIASINHFTNNNMFAFTDFNGLMTIFFIFENKALTIDGMNKFIFKGGWASKDRCVVLLANPEKETEVYIFIPEEKRLIESNGEHKIIDMKSITWLNTSSYRGGGYFLKFSNNDFLYLGKNSSTLSDCITNRRLDTDALPKISYRTQSLGEYNTIVELFNSDISTNDCDSRLYRAYDLSVNAFDNRNNESTEYLKKIIKEELNKRLK